MEDYQETVRRSKAAWEKWAEVFDLLWMSLFVKVTVIRYLLLKGVKLFVRSLLLLEIRFNHLVNW